MRADDDDDGVERFMVLNVVGFVMATAAGCRGAAPFLAIFRPPVFARGKKVFRAARRQRPAQRGAVQKPP
jgi:hypothetical protein